MAEALEGLRDRRLVRGDGVISLTEVGREDYERIVAARCERLRELLDGWDPDEHTELRRLVDELGRDLVNEMPTPAAALV